MLTLSTWLRQGFSGFSSRELLFPSPLHSLLCQRKSPCSPRSGSRRLCSISSRAEYLHKLYGELLHERFVSSFLFLYVFNRVFVLYGLMDFYCIWWVITQYCFLFIAHIVPALTTGALPVGTCSSCVPIFVIFFNISCFLHLEETSTTRCSKLPLHIFSPSPRISHFPMDPQLLLLENRIGNQYLGA